MLTDQIVNKSHLGRVAAATVLALIATAATVLAGFSGTDVFLPMVGRKAGVHPSNWYTTVWIHNPDAAAATVRVHLLERDKANPAPPWVDVMVAPGDTEMLENVVESLFHVEVFGALRVTCPSKVLVTSRVYSQAVGTGEADTVGQDFAAVPASFAIGLQERTQILGVHQTLPKADSEMRYNFGFVETTGHPVTVRVRAFDDNGVELGAQDIPVREWSQRQLIFSNYFSSVSTENSRLEIEVVSGSGKVIAYGSGIANNSQDPTTFEMAYPDRVLAENAAAGITGVTAGGGLTGGGAAGAVTLDVGAGEGITVAADTVALADGGVTTDKLAPAAVSTDKIAPSATAGQVLTTIAGGSPAPGDSAMALAGTAVAWRDPAPLPPSGPAGGSLSGTYPNPGIATGAVGSTQLASNAVTSDKILDGAVGADDIGTDAIGNIQLANDAVTGANILNGSIGADDIGAGAVRNTHLAGDAVTGDRIVDGSVEGVDIADLSIGSSKIASGAVGSAEIASGAVLNSELGANAVTTDKIADGAVGTNDLANNAVTTDKIANAAVTAAKVSTGGGSTGQVLTVTASGAAWQAAGGISLPYADGVTSSFTAFKMTNTGTGAALEGVGGSGAGVYGSSSSYAAVHGLRGSASGYSPLTAPGVWGDSNAGPGVFGSSWSAGGVGGQSSSGPGVTGISTSGVGVTGGSTSGYGVSGTSSSSAGVYGQSTNNYGVHGATSYGHGVHGTASADDGHGVFGQGTQTGVSGFSTRGSGTTYGVYGEAASSGGYGVYGRNGANSSFGALGASVGGVYGQGSTAGYFAGSVDVAASSTSYGVDVYNTAGGDGIRARARADSGNYWAALFASNTGTSPGLYAYSTAGPAAYLNGNVTVVGSLSKGGGSFKIDHPLDPENRYLYHSFVESPDMMNIYNGNATLDDNGEAWVELPKWFEALNAEFRYQLTCIGGFAPVYVAEEITGNRFRIAGGRTGMRVSWQVTGVRQDRWAQAHRIPVEEAKPAEELGTYLHAAEWGRPERSTELTVAAKEKGDRAQR
jgi:hypothetical protein